MFPYWLLFTVFAAGALQTRGRFTTAQSMPLLAAAGLFVALMVGLRFEVGGDWGNYLGIFDYLSYVSFGEALAFSDPGYALLNWLANVAGVEIWAVNLACGAIFTWGLVKLARQQPNAWLACLVAVPYLIIVVAMGYTRQAVAIGFIMAALVAFTHHKVPRAIFYFVLAVTFHKTALIVLPLVLAAMTRNRIFLGSIMLLMGAILYYVFLIASVDRLLTNYVEADLDSSGALVRIAMTLLPAAIFLVFQKRFLLDEMERKVWRNFSLAAVGAAVALYFVASSAAVDRAGLYLVPLQLVVLSRLPYIVGLQETLRQTFVLLVIAYSAAVQFIWLNYAVNAESWVPYQVFPIGAEQRLRY